MTDLAAPRLLLDSLGDHLAARETESGVVSRVGVSSAFEGWLAVEARLAMQTRLASADPSDRKAWTVSTEYPSKTDLSVYGAGGELVSAFEFKLVYNNKNWKTACDAVWRDLFPPRGSAKAALTPRFAVVTSIFMQFDEEAKKAYPGQDADDGPDGWRQRMRKYLYPHDGWQGRFVQRIAGPKTFDFEGLSGDFVSGVRHGLEIEIAAESRS
jgi:hypothetical protein